MIALPKSRYSPIGVDIGSRSVKLLQMDGARGEIIEKSHWDLEAVPGCSDEAFDAAVTSAIKQARAGRSFRGRKAVVCLSSRELFVQNVRVAKSAEQSLDELVEQEATGRIPFPTDETDLRYLEPAEIRSGDGSRREIILLACHRPILNQAVRRVLAAGLRPISVDAEPTALLRCYAQQYRRDEDREARVMYVHIGAASAPVVIAQGSVPLFVKYLAIGGDQMDELVARTLGMELQAAQMLRCHSGDRRRDQQDSEVASEIAHAVRPVLDRLANELSLCMRYHSVTFRGQPLARVVVGGGEATESLASALAGRLNVQCEVGDPFRHFKSATDIDRSAQWDVATGLALREVKP